MKREPSEPWEHNDAIGGGLTSRRELLRHATAVGAGALAASGAFFATTAHASPVTRRAASLFVTQSPTNTNQTDAGQSYELGTRFTTSEAGQITAIRYYKAPSEGGPHFGRLWEMNGGTGTLLATVEFKNESSSGWQQQALATPLPIVAGRTYVVSVNSSTHFAYTSGGLAAPVTSGPLSTSLGNGVLSSTPGAYPSIISSASHSYFRDVVFTPAQTLLDTKSPFHQNLTDNTNYELGLRFKARRKGKLTAIRYWRSPGDVGAHVGNIWTGSGALLASVAFVNESSSGWQQQTLPTALEIEADTPYVVSVNCNWYFPDSLDGLAGPGVISGDLSSVVGNNGVFTTTVGSFPTSSYRNGNYFRDVVFVPTNAIVAENQNPGDAGWKLSNFATDEIVGFASTVSVNRGGSLALKVHVKTAGTQYRIDVYRLGWYGGKGGRLMTTLGPKMGTVQPAPTTVAAAERLVECNWLTTDTLNVPVTWTTGLYHAKVTELTTNKETAIWFVVRDDESRADILFQASFTTMLAYNNFGGKCLYGHLSTSSQRALKVSLERPFSQATLFNPGIGTQLPTINSLEHSPLHLQYNMLRWLESQGYDVTYVTSLEVHQNSTLLAAHRVFLSVGHDEYWSLEMRQHVESARDQGVNLAFFSANTAYWRVTFEPSPTTGTIDRVMVCYKEDWPLGDLSTPTNRFRSGVTNQLPENQLLGVMYIGQKWNGNVGFPFRVAPAAALDPYFAHTGLRGGEQLPGLVGFEWDAVIDNGRTPSGLVVLGESTVQSESVESSADDDTYVFAAPGTSFTQTAHATRYTAASGAKVFATGSVQWVYGLDSDYLYVNGHLRSFEDLRAKQIASNHFSDMSSRPMTPSAGIIVYGAP
jgi:hypothetical protein